MNWKKFTSAEDLAHELGLDTQILIHDGCEYHIDYVDTDVETGTYFMANQSEPEQYHQLCDDSLIAIHDSQIDDMSNYGGGN